MSGRKEQEYILRDDARRQVLGQVGETWKPKGATAIVMDPRDAVIGQVVELRPFAQDVRGQEERPVVVSLSPRVSIPATFGRYPQALSLHVLG